MTLQKIKKGALVAAVAVAGLLGAATQVTADPGGPVEPQDARGCTATHGGFVCIDVMTDGPQVRQARGSYNGLGVICDVKFRLHGYLWNGKYYSSTKTAKCGGPTVWADWFSFPEQGVFKPGTPLCVQPFVSGAWRNQKACIKIK